MIQTKKLLGTSTVTLTVSTNPSSATCTLTYGGNSYSSKTATVPVGTTISYSIYHSTYGTTTGSITMDKNKTLTCNGTYSTSTKEVVWTQPTLSSNTGNEAFTVTPEHEWPGYQAWRAFDNNSTTMWKALQSAQANIDCPIVIYSKTAIRPISVSIQNSTGAAPKNQSWGKASLYASNTGSFNSSNLIGSGTNPDTSTSGAIWTFSAPSTIYYNYFKVVGARTIAANNYIYITQITINGYYQTTAYNYYWDKTIS